ncbi:MAG TPA: hypothetical protein VMQ83_07415, partial [Gammaproteobacteria bacterium]|nr:hypothetical protein [Gammaproteobacteria bacterium]
MPRTRNAAQYRSPGPVLCALLALLSAGASAAEDRCALPKRAAEACTHRVGHCVEVTIDGQ